MTATVTTMVMVMFQLLFECPFFHGRYNLDPRGPFVGLAQVEDLYFSVGIIIAQRKMPPRSVAMQFSSETMNIPDSFGMHKFYRRTAEECRATMLKYFNVSTTDLTKYILASQTGPLTGPL